MAFANNRVFYASHALSINDTTVQGGQSVSVNTNFNLENVFQLGRLAIYDNVPLDPEVEITVNKVLDGHPTIFNLATGGGSLVGTANQRSKVELAVGKDTDGAIGATAGTPNSIVMTGCYISSLTYTIPVDGNFTEDVTLIGTSKEITNPGAVAAPTAAPLGGANPAVLRRQNYSSTSTVPNEVQGKRLSQVTISADLGREAIYELGRFEPYHRFVNFPLEITVAFDVIADDHDNVDIDVSQVGQCQNPDLADEQEIVIRLCNSAGAITYTFNLEDKCTLQTVAYSGGDTGGGNVTITYTYLTYNTLTITG